MQPIGINLMEYIVLAENSARINVSVTRMNPKCKT